MNDRLAHLNLSSSLALNEGYHELAKEAFAVKIIEILRWKQR
jgi:hypothetical protein